MLKTFDSLFLDSFPCYQTKFQRTVGGPEGGGHPGDRRHLQMWLRGLPSSHRPLEIKQQHHRRLLQVQHQERILPCESRSLWWLDITTFSSRSIVLIFSHSFLALYHRVIILNRGSMLRKRTGKGDANFPDQNVKRLSVTSLETARSLANGSSWGGGEGELREKYVFCVHRELQRLLSLFCLWEESVGGA